MNRDQYEFLIDVMARLDLSEELKHVAAVWIIAEEALGFEP